MKSIINLTGDSELAQMAVFKFDDTIAGTLEAVVVSQAQGHAYVMEQGRLGHLEGKVGSREALSHRIISESGAGQSRAFLPGGMGGAPSVVPPSLVTK